MRKLLLALLLVACSAYAYAEGGGVSNTSGNNNDSDPATYHVTTASYVKGAYRAVNQEKIGTTITQQMNGNTITGNAPEGSVITGVTVTTGTDSNNNPVATGLTVTRSNVKLPNNSANNTSSYSSVWID